MQNTMTKVIINKIFPVKGFSAITIWPFIFARHELSEKTMRHERIHYRQQIEMLLLLVYLWSGLEWVFRIIKYRNADKAYMNISFEREAYANENDSDYLKNRKIFAWIKYLNKTKKIE